jgi:hypothetical protein
VFLLHDLHVELPFLQGPTVGENSLHLEKKTNLAGEWRTNGLTESLVHGGVGFHGPSSMDLTGVSPSSTIGQQNEPRSLHGRLEALNKSAGGGVDNIYSPRTVV